MSGEVVVLQPAFPPYRVLFLRRLVESNPQVVLLGGLTRTDPTVRTAAASDLPAFVEQRNHYLLGRRVLVQRGFRRTVRAAAAVVDLNPRNLTTWLVLLARRLLRRPTVVFGHGRGRGGKRAPVADVLRRVQARLSNGVLVYTEAEIERFPSSCRVRAVGNGLYERSATRDTTLDAAPDYSFVSSSRLVENKEVDLLLEALRDVAERLPPTVADKELRLHIVGDGPERERLGELASVLEVDDYINWHGAVWDADTTQKIYRSARFGIAPGCVGLNAVQSLAHGRPFVWRAHTAAQHGPEVASLNENNALMAQPEENPATELVKAMLAVGSSARHWELHAQAIQDDVFKSYSVENMVDAFETMLVDVLKG